MIGDGDVEAILSNGDFDTQAVFTLVASPLSQVTVRGWFTSQSDEVTMFGQVQIEAQKPSFVCQTSAITAVRNMMSVVINSVTYIVERIEKTGMDASVVYLKT